MVVFEYVARTSGTRVWTEQCSPRQWLTDAYDLTHLGFTGALMDLLLLLQQASQINKASSEVVSKGRKEIWHERKKKRQQAFDKYEQCKLKSHSSFK